MFFLSRKFGLDTGQLGMVFFAVGFLEAGSVLAATRLGQRFGLLNTMVFTHLPSNLLLAGIAFALNGIGIGLLLARFALSQMDVPMRQAYVTAMVDPHERVAASAYTATARYAIHPAGPFSPASRSTSRSGSRCDCRDDQVDLRPHAVVMAATCASARRRHDRGGVR